MANKLSNKNTKEFSILQDGVGDPYIAIFDSKGNPIINPLTGIALGAYISKFDMVFDEEKENLSSITFDTGNPDSVDIASLQEKETIILQWGYIYSDGSSLSSSPVSIEVRDFEANFDDQGTHVTIKCIDTPNDLRRLLPVAPTEEDAENTFSKVMDKGFGIDLGIIIEEFK